MHRARTWLAVLSQAVVAAVVFAWVLVVAAVVTVPIVVSKWVGGDVPTFEANGALHLRNYSLPPNGALLWLATNGENIDLTTYTQDPIFSWRFRNLEVRYKVCARREVEIPI